MTQVHPTAVVAEGAELGVDADIGPYCVVGPEVRIGDRTRLHAHVVLDGKTRIGEACNIFPFACIGTQTQDLKFKGQDTFVEIGDRTTLREYVTVNSGTSGGEVTRVGSDCHIMAYAHIAHACSVGNSVIMANCATLAGEVVVEDFAILGGMAGVHQFVRIGCMSILGGCTKVTQDVMPYMLVDGNPAKIHGLNRVGLKRRGVSEEAQRQLKLAHRIMCREQLTTSEAVARIRETLAGCEEVTHLLDFVEASDRGLVK